MNDWRSRAACGPRDGIDWFPRTVSDRNMTEGERQNLADARRLCDGCPVRAECLADALAVGAEQHGIRAGLTEDERHQLRERGRGTRLPAACGTNGGYYRHRRLGQNPCPKCNEAHNAAQRKTPVGAAV